MSKKRRRPEEEETSYWLSYSDMMAALLLIFILIISFTLMQSKSQYESKQAELDKQKEIIHELARIMFVRASLTTCNEKQLPHIAAAFGVSLHWLMGMPSTLRLYAKHSTTEDIIDAYYFMPAANKTEFKRAVKKFVAKLAEMEAEQE